MDPAAFPTRRKYRFSIRVLLLLVLVTGGGLGWVAAVFRRALRRCDAAARVVSLHGTVDYGSQFRLEG